MALWDRESVLSVGGWAFMGEKVWIMIFIPFFALLFHVVAIPLFGGSGSTPFPPIAIRNTYTHSWLDIIY